MNLIDRLERYSEKCLAEVTDPDFAAAVQEVIQIVQDVQAVEPVHVGYDDAQLGREK